MHMRSNRVDYPFEIRPLSPEEGGGFLISYPDFSDCLSDGESVEEALANGKDALKATIAALKAKDLPIPAPNSGGVASQSDEEAMRGQCEFRIPSDDRITPPPAEPVTVAAH